MHSESTVDGRERFVRHYTYDDSTVTVVDLGPGFTDASVDVVDGTAIVLADGPGEDRHIEFDIDDEAAQVFIKNGVLSIEVNA